MDWKKELDALARETAALVERTATANHQAPVERTTATLMPARKNRLDMSVNIALGSASQIALFVAPVLLTSGAFVGMWRERIAEFYSKYMATAAAERATQ